MDPTNINNILASNLVVSEEIKKENSEISDNDTWITGRESLFDSVEDLSCVTTEINELKDEDKQPSDIQDILNIIRKIRMVLRNVSIVYKITKWDILTVYIGIFLYSLDVVANFIVAMIYFSVKFINCGSLTLIIMIVPSFFIRLIDRLVLWKMVKHKGWYWIWIWPYFLINIDPLYKYHLLLKLIRAYFNNCDIFGLVQQKTALKVYNTFIKLMRKVAISKVLLMKCQTIPLIVLHLTILIYNIDRKDMNLTRTFQLLTITISSIGIITTHFANYRTSKFLTCIRVNFLGGLLYTLGLSIPIICRCVAISACLSFSITATIIIITLHCFSAIYWSYIGGGITDKKIINSIITGVELTMIPLFSAPRRALITNSILLLENLVMLLIWGIPEGSKFSLLLSGCILSIDIIFRLTHILYCKYRNNFITTILL